MFSLTLGAPLAFLPFVGGVGTSEWLIIGVVAVLLFGKRLPEVGRSLGKSLMEFKKGMAGIEDEIRNAGNISSTGANSRTSTPRYQELEERDEPTAPKFEPPRSEPRPEASSGTEAA